MIPSTSLLYPRYRSLANRAARLDRSGWTKVISAAVFVLAVWVGLYLGLVELLRILYDVELLGPYLVDRLLALLLLSFSAILLLSNIVTSLAAYYLSAELHLVNAAPISWLRLFYAKFTENLAVSSWMVVVFGVPVVLAYGTVHEVGLGFFAVACVAAAGFFVIPAAFGVVLTTLLVNIFPARAARDLFIIVTAVFLGGAWILFRVVRPERLVNPEAFSGLAQFLGSLTVPESAWLPSTWASQALATAMRGELGAGFEAAGYLLLWGAACVVLAAWITSALYLGGWSRAQEGRPARLKGLAGTQLQRFGSIFLGRAGGALLAKDLKVLVRDPTQWSQLVLLIALVAIYLFSIHALPFEVLQFDTRNYRNAVAFLNIGMTGFVQAAVAARFVYPSVSAEGRGIWILRSSPASAAEVVRAKWLAGVVPILVFGEVLAITSNILLGTDDVIRWLAVLNAAVTAFAVCGLAVGLGSMMPDFTVENAAKAAASFGGLVYMTAALVYLGGIIAVQSYPIFRLLMAQQFDRVLGGGFWLSAVAGLMVTLGGTAVLCLLVLRRGASSLELREL